MRALAAQLGGHADLRPGKPSGTTAVLRFPVAAPGEGGRQGPPETGAQGGTATAC